MITSNRSSENIRSTSRNKENGSFISFGEFEYLKSIVMRSEQSMMEIRKELKQKVNKSEFLEGMGSKLSLSDATNLSFQFNHKDLSSMRYQKDTFEQQTNLKLKRIEQQSTKQLQHLSKQIKDLQTKMQIISFHDQKRILECQKQMRAIDQSIILKLQKKAQRSQLDKMMHLSSLLAIEFQLIKKRFTNFEMDYNMVWKEISNLYSNHQNLRSVFQTEKKQSFEDTQQKQLQMLLKTGKNVACIAKLFDDNQDLKQVNSKHQPNKQFHEKIEFIQTIQHDHQFTINNFAERITAIENDIEKWSFSFGEIEKVKKSFNDTKYQIQLLGDRSKHMKQDLSDYMEQKSDLSLKQISKNTSKQIKQASEQIAKKMFDRFSECSKIQQTQTLKKRIEQIEEMVTSKLDAFSDSSKKRYELIHAKIDNHQDKIRLMAKQVGQRLKMDEFQFIKQGLMTVENSHSLLKKAEHSIRKEMEEMKNTQNALNEVFCSENIVARWVWISGQLKGGNLVSWDKQVVNTLPQNFIYNKGQYTFKITKSGIYKIELGFYAKKKPSIQIIINGKIIVSAVNSSSYVVHHSSGKLKDISNTQIAGLTYYDFFTLQDNARLAISYTGQIGHGFVHLQRL